MPDKSHLGVTGGTKTHGVGRMSKLQHVRIFNVFALGLLSYASLLSAQIITGEITGTVTDPSGAAVPGATVTATCTATNASRTATTGNSGSYVLSNLPPCLYNLSVSAQGFKTSLSGADVAVGITIRSEEHTSELQSRLHLVCRLLLEKKKKNNRMSSTKPDVYHSISPLARAS